MANAIYSNARAKALENTLLTKDRLNRMVESVSADEAVKILYEVNFGDGLIIDGAPEFERLIQAEEKKFIFFIKEVSASDYITKYFLLENDYHNAEAIIRSKYIKTDYTAMLKPNGLYDSEDLAKKIMTDDYGDFSEELSAVLSFADSEFVAGRANGANINSAFRKALFKELLTCSKKNGELKNIFECRADCVNIGTALRTRNFSEAEKYFVPGGTLDSDILKILCEEDYDVLKEKCRFFPRSDFILSAINREEKPLTEFEKLADDYAMDILIKNKYSAQGLLPFVIYCYYKYAEIKNVRIVMVGLLNGWDKNDIKRRLRKGYEG